jgi:hypothetical protein
VLLPNNRVLVTWRDMSLSPVDILYTRSQ